MIRSTLFLCTSLAVLLPATANAQLTQEKLRETVQRSIKENPIAIERPTFRIDRYALYYRFGGLVRYEDGTDQADKPLVIPADTQFAVELIRQYPWRPVNRRIWERRLTAIEGIISKELALISTYRGPQDRLLKALNDYKAQTDGLMMEAVEIMARREGREVQPVGAVRNPDGTWRRTAEKYIKGFTVTIKALPKDAKVFYLTVADYELAQDANMANHDATWYSITPGSSKTLGGNYMFRAKWSKGTIASPAKYSIDKEDQVITLTPDK